MTNASSIESSSSSLSDDTVVEAMPTAIRTTRSKSPLTSTSNCYATVKSKSERISAIDVGGVGEVDNDVPPPNHAKFDDIECLYGQHYATLHRECVASRRLFEDPHFPAHNRLLRSRSAKQVDEVQWLRPGEIMASLEVHMMLDAAADDDGVDDEDSDSFVDSVSGFADGRQNLKRSRRKQPVLIDDGFDRNKANSNNGRFDFRSALDAWFVPAMSVIADDRKMLLRRVVPDANQGFDADVYAGIFHFRLWFGRWIDIVIDDRLPCRKSVPIYCRSASIAEMWPALLEKAYAKAKGSYEALTRWMPIDALIEMTAGVPERIDDVRALKYDELDATWLLLERAVARRDIVIASCPTPKSSETAGKSNAEAQQLMRINVKVTYRLVQLIKLGTDALNLWFVRLVNVSGPESRLSPLDQHLLMRAASAANGFSMWLRADTHDIELRASRRIATEVCESLRSAINNMSASPLSTPAATGFWTPFADFIRYFKTIDICHLTRERDDVNDSEQDDEDHVITFHGRWEVGLNAGGTEAGNFAAYATNPQCFVRLTGTAEDDFSSAVVSLMQRRRADSRAKGRHFVGFKIFRVPDAMRELPASFFAYVRPHDGCHRCVAKTLKWTDSREVNLRVSLPPAKYCIIPSTLRRDAEGDFILRVHIERPPLRPPMRDLSIEHVR